MNLNNLKLHCNKQQSYPPQFNKKDMIFLKKTTTDYVNYQRIKIGPDTIDNGEQFGLGRIGRYYG